MIDIKLSSDFFYIDFISGDLLAAINSDFGSLENLKSQLAAQTIAVQGSGWGWLGYNKQKKMLQIATCPNQVSKINIIAVIISTNVINMSDGPFKRFLSLFPS